jgi:hypothetical protein
LRIISKFRDYYDLPHEFVDESVVYLRKQATSPLQRGEGPRLAKLEAKSHGRKPSGGIVSESWEISFEVIGFCGKLFPVILCLRLGEAPSGSAYSASGRYGFYELKDFLRFAAARGIEVPSSRRYRWFPQSAYDLSLEAADMFLKGTGGLEALLPIFRKENAPCFVARQGGRGGPAQITTNPFLKGYSFAKVKDPFTAHQEISQYVGGLLPQPERPMIEVSDKDKVAKHGFNEWSFRRPPQKK